MKYVISASEKNLDSFVDSRFGRAQFFALYDTGTKNCTWHENTQNYQATQGAGIQTAQNVINLGAQAVISGNCGPKAFKVLSAANVQVYTISDNVKITEAVELAETGKIQPNKGANVEGHW